MTPLSHRVWFVRYAPTSKIQLHPTLSLTLNDGQPWFETLVQDIAAHGLYNPILVHNGIMPCDELIPCRVAHGSNRYRAIRRLGWKYIPVLIVGILPQWASKDAKELHSLEECQSYINDGAFENHKHGVRIVGSVFAQEARYVTRPDPYLDKPETQ